MTKRKVKILKSPAKGEKRTAKQWAGAFQANRLRENDAAEAKHRAKLNPPHLFDVMTKGRREANARDERIGKSDAILGAFHDARIKPGVFVNGSIMSADEYSKIRRSLTDRLADYCVRQGDSDGKWGIYLRAYNVRVAVFADNSHSIREVLTRTFEAARVIQRPKRRKK